MSAGAGWAVWMAEQPEGRARYVSVTNTGDVPNTLTMNFGVLGMAIGAHAVRDVWPGRSLGRANELRVALRPHASVLYAVGTGER